MLLAATKIEIESATLSMPPIAASQLSVQPLTANETAEVLALLSARPIHTVVLCGLIRDNGLVSPLNRGTFYGCRNRHGQLEGVALIGHITLMETTTDRALEAFAEVAQKCTIKHLMMGEKERIEEFWNSYSGIGQQMRRACRELLFELCWPIEVQDDIAGLRLATLEDLELVMPIQAEMAFEESGVDPMLKDPEGFRQRCSRRISQGRTWVMVEGGELIFKAEVISDTPEVVYLEGIWVNPRVRGQHVGLRCLSKLARNLLSHTLSLCLFVNAENRDAHKFYRKAGYKLRGVYDTIFVE